MNPTLLIVDDEESVRESFRLVLEEEYSLVFAENCREALQILKNQTFDLCLLDILLPDGTGIDLLRQIKRKDERLDVIMVTALQGVDTALDAMKLGAYDYITKPYRVEQLTGLIRRVLNKRALEKENRVLREEVNQRKPAYLMGESKPLVELLGRIKDVATANVPILLVGENGTGLEEIGWEIHRQSLCAKGPFIKVDCGGPAGASLEAELFGQEREDLKSKSPYQIGKLEFADGGTLFLDQVDRLPLGLQEKLLKVFEEKKLRRLHSEIFLPADIRVVACLTPDAYQGREKTLQPEFLRHLEGFLLQVPTLAQRKADIPLLIHHFLKVSNSKSKVPVNTIEREAVRFLTEYPWPGNIQELKNSVEMMVLFSGRETLTVEDIPLDILVKQMDLAQTKEEAEVSLKRVRRQFERHYIRKVLERTRGNQSRTASALGLHRNTLIWKLKELQMMDDYKRIVKKRRELGLGFRDLG